MSPVEQQRSPIRALVNAALQTDAESPETARQIDEALAGGLDDPWADIFCGSPERSQNQSENSS